ncbi:transglutaminase family protein [Acuticoccus sp. I52.16.1]|uniref:transglutaminase-like domain-containing protein n=1 Tax=Acuticoccus sp. I52.16.1 TaxID=2928472 RepID=UPI001FD05040|nr:transglutaminase family protein [Acuticoccus sp. I52.16.1]UOM36546.1 transglutaminase family protein [Acuticoccus sp. I52.16.1]
MYIRFGFEIALTCKTPTTLILGLSPHSAYTGRIIGSDRLKIEPDLPVDDILDPFGNRLVRLHAPAGPLRLSTDCIADADGAPDPYDWNAAQHEVADLPPETLPYLMASRYCESDVLSDEAWRLFAGTPMGWGRVQAISNFVHNHLTFGYGFGRPTKTAAEAYKERTGVCRDFAHLMIALCRAMSIPARYASGYLGDIGVPPSGPGDFSAWTEIYLGDRWHTFDARHNIPRIGRILMVRGRDAADGAMMTTFGAYDLKLFKVWTEEVAGGTDSELEAMLGRHPDVEALTLAPANPAFPAQNGIGAG